MAVGRRGDHGWGSRRTSPSPPTPRPPRPQTAAKTDRSDARLLRTLLVDGDLRESWIPPECVLEWRERVRLYKSLVDQRTEWTQRINAELFQHGLPVPDGEIATAATRARLCDPAVAMSDAARQRIGTGYAMIDATNAEALLLRAELARFGTRQPACRALEREHFGVGGLTAAAIWSELGDCRRFSVVTVTYESGPLHATSAVYVPTWVEPGTYRILPAGQVLGDAPASTPSAGPS